MSKNESRWKTVKVDVEEGIGWVTLNRPEKRNAMSPTLNNEMREVLEALEIDEDVKVLVLTGAGESFSAGMDLKEYFREMDKAPEAFQEKIRRDASTWQWKLLRPRGGQLCREARKSSEVTGSGRSAHPERSIGHNDLSRCRRPRGRAHSRCGQQGRQARSRRRR